MFRFCSIVTDLIDKRCCFEFNKNTKYLQFTRESKISIFYRYFCDNESKLGNNCINSIWFCYIKIFKLKRIDVKTLNLHTYMKHTILNEISTMESQCSSASQRRERFWREFTIFEPRTTRWPSIAIKVIGILQFLGSGAIVEQFTNFIAMCAIWQGVTERKHAMSSAGK